MQKNIPTGIEPLPERQSFVVFVGRMHDAGEGIYDPLTEGSAIVRLTDNGVNRPKNGSVESREVPRQLTHLEIAQAAAFILAGVSCELSFTEGLPEDKLKENAEIIKWRRAEGEVQPPNVWGAVIVSHTEDVRKDDFIGTMNQVVKQVDNGETSSVRIA